MRKFAGIEVENAAQMSQVERLEAAFRHITNSAIKHIENDMELAQVMNDDEKKKLYHIQVGMYRHAQSIFAVAKNFATDEQWHQ